MQKSILCMSGCMYISTALNAKMSTEQYMSKKEQKKKEIKKAIYEN